MGSCHQHTLGFEKCFDYGVPVFYAGVSRDGFDVHFSHRDQPPAKGERETDIIDLYVTVADMEYGMQEFYVEDCNGYRLAFGQPTEEK